MPASRSILIVGASGTIGSAVARQLAASDVVLGLHYRSNLAAATDLKTTLEAAETACHLMPSPLGSEAACRALIDDFVARTGRIDGLALCGGTIHWKEWNGLAADDWQRTLFEHCVAPFCLARHAASRMESSQPGRVVYLSSIAPKYGGSAKTIHYAAAKAALETAMRGMARELARSGIRINGVRAGFVDTPQHQHGRSAGEIARRIALIPVGRAGKPDEVASAFAYLFSENASFINCELITVAGGD
jgi:3-oxoacyl-[acyl-carrier protein] reductase